MYEQKYKKKKNTIWVKIIIPFFMKTKNSKILNKQFSQVA